VPLAFQLRQFALLVGGERLIERCLSRLLGLRFPALRGCQSSRADLAWSRYRRSAPLSRDSGVQFSSDYEAPKQLSPDWWKSSLPVAAAQSRPAQSQPNSF